LAVNIDSTKFSANVLQSPFILYAFLIKVAQCSNRTIEQAFDLMNPTCKSNFNQIKFTQDKREISFLSLQFKITHYNQALRTFKSAELSAD